MSFGKIILGLASIVTLGCALAFRMFQKFGRNRIYAKTAVNSRNCKACRTFFTGQGFLFTRCKTSNGIHTLFGTEFGARVYAFTQLTSFQMKKCGGNKVTEVSMDE